MSAESQSGSSVIGLHTPAAPDALQHAAARHARDDDYRHRLGFMTDQQRRDADRNLLALAAVQAKAGRFDLQWSVL